MFISLSLFICWFLFGVLVLVAQKWHNQQLAFVFLFVEIVNCNVPFLLGDAFHFYKITDNPQLYVSYSLYQVLFVPAFYTITIYYYNHVSLRHKKAVILLVSAAVFFLFEYLTFRLNIIESSGLWKLAAILFYRLLLLFLTLFALTGFKRMCSK